MSLTTCPKCAQPVTEGDRFCESCGQQLISQAPVTEPSPPPVPAMPSVVAPSTTPVAADHNVASPVQPAGKNKPLLLIAAGILVAALAIIWIYPGKSKGFSQNAAGPKTGTLTGTGNADNQSTPSATPDITISIAPPRTPGTTESANNSTTPQRGVELFTHSFQTPRSIFIPLFGPGVMRVTNVAGEGRLEGLSAGILPAMLGKFLLNDFVLECDMRPQSVAPGGRYGFIFRSADVSGGAISAYYIVTVAPNEDLVAMNCWNQSRWVMTAQQPLPARTIRMGQTHRLTVVANGTQFTVYINDQLVAQFTDSSLTEGRLGLCLAPSAAKSDVVYFDNFAIYMPP